MEEVKSDAIYRRAYGERRRACRQLRTILNVLENKFNTRHPASALADICMMQMYKDTASIFQAILEVAEENESIDGWAQYWLSL